MIYNLIFSQFTNNSKKKIIINIIKKVIDKNYNI